VDGGETGSARLVPIEERGRGDRAEPAAGLGQPAAPRGERPVAPAGKGDPGVGDGSRIIHGR
jgi:hypothetical protein